MGELDEAAAWLEKVTRDPMADAVRGTVRILSASPLAARGRFQECSLTVRAEAPGVPPRDVELAAVFHRKDWPAVGRVLPALVSPSAPAAVEVDWDALRR